MIITKQFYINQLTHVETWEAKTLHQEGLLNMSDPEFRKQRHYFYSYTQSEEINVTKKFWEHHICTMSTSWI